MLPGAASGTKLPATSPPGAAYTACTTTASILLGATCPRICASSVSGSDAATGAYEEPEKRVACPVPALTKSGVKPITGPSRANCVCSGELYTTTPSVTYDPDAESRTGAATSTAGMLAESSSVPWTVAGQAAARAGSADTAEAGASQTGVCASPSTVFTDGSDAVTWGTPPDSHCAVGGCAVRPLTLVSHSVV